MITWRKNLVTLELCKKKLQYIHVKVKNSTGKEWMFTTIHAPPNEDNKKAR